MTNLQAAAAAQNLLADLKSVPSSVTFNVELMCIGDAGDRGPLVWRTEQGDWLLPSMRTLHWVKRYFE